MTVAWTAVAHIVVGSKQEEQDLRNALNKGPVLSEQAAIASTAPFIYPATQNILEKCFQKAYGRTKIPAHWERHHWAPKIGENLWQPPIDNPGLTDQLPYVEEPHHMYTRASR